MKQDVPAEMVEFMEEIKAAVEKLVGKDGKVAMLGDHENGVFCMMFSLSNYPNLLIMASCLQMMTAALHAEVASTYQMVNDVPDKVM